jgi:hypothetical protein
MVPGAATLVIQYPFLPFFLPLIIWWKLEKYFKRHTGTGTGTFKIKKSTAFF